MFMLALGPLWLRRGFAAVCVGAAIAALGSVLPAGGHASGAALSSAPSSPPSAAPRPLAWDPACYPTYEQMTASLQATAATYPGIASLVDAGLAWEGTRHVWAMRLGSSLHPEPKPAVLLVAGQHPRDISTTAILLRLIAHLTIAYGTDPTATWLLDNRTLTIIPSANPDGYYRVYHCDVHRYHGKESFSTIIAEKVRN